MKTSLICCHLVFFCVGVCVAHAQNHVLELDGDGDYVRIPHTY